MAAVVDAHHHFWELGRFEYAWLDAPGLERIHKTYLPAHLAPHLAAAGVARTIFVQTRHDLDETRWALGLARSHAFLAGVVGWVDLRSPRCEEQVLELAADRHFVGVRHVTHDEPDDDFLVREDVMRGLAVLAKHRVPFDLLLYVKHLRHVPVLAAALPDLRMVIDHLAKPNIRARELDEWRAPFAAAARCPNVFCKLSGMITEADRARWKPADLAPYVEWALERFGPERCMFGSDWPVCELAGSYEDVVGALRTALGAISASEEERIFAGTATELYGLEGHVSEATPTGPQ